MHSFSAISQANDEEQNIYNTVINYYVSNYQNDTTKTVLIIDTTKTLKDEKLNTIIEITRKFQDGNYCSYYHDYLDVDTSDFKNIEKLNKMFSLKTMDVENLIEYFDKNKNIQFISQSYIDSIFYPFRSIKSYDNAANVHDILNNCWFKLNTEKNCLGYCSFSRPYIVDQNKALIYFSFAHGSMAGMSMILILSKDLNVWTVKKIISIAIS